jgi:hypothetical protein
MFGPSSAFLVSTSTSCSGSGSGSGVVYANHDAVRAAGAAQIYGGQPDYFRKLDRGGDGATGS